MPALYGRQGCPPLPALALCLLALLASCAVCPTFAATYYWDNNGSTAGFGTAGGTWAVPTIGDASQGWSTNSAGTLLPGNVTTVAADDLNFGLTTNGLAVGTITISGTVTNNTLTFASGSGAITLTGGTIALGGTAPTISLYNQNNTIHSPILLLTNATISAPDFGTGSIVSTLTLGGGISGSANVIFHSANTSANNSQQTILLNTPSSYTGSTTLNPAGNGANLIVKLGVDNALPPATVLSLNGVAAGGSGRFARLELNGFDQTLGGLQNTPASQRSQIIRNSSATAATLTVSNIASYIFSGRVESNLTLIKGGVGTLILSGTNNYNGPTLINAGTLTLGGAGLLGGTSGLYAANITNNAGFEYSSSIAQTLSGVISGSGSLTNSGPGTLTITGTDTLPLNVADGGTFEVSGSGNVSSSVSIYAGGSLSLTGGGRVNTVTVNIGGDVSLPDTGTATNLTFTGTGTMSFDFATSNTVGNLTVIAASGITNNGAANSVTINLTGSVPTDGTYTLIAYSGTLRGSGFSAYQLGTVPFGKSYTLVNAAGAVQLTVAPAPNFIGVETKADGTGEVVPDSTILTGTSLTNYAILRTGTGVFITNTPATWVLTNITGSVVATNLVTAPGGKSAVFKPMGDGSARILATVPGTNSVPSGMIATAGLFTRPFIWVRDSEKAGIQDKIATNAWATTIYTGMVARVASKLASHQLDRDVFLRELPVEWTNSPAEFKTIPAYSESLVRGPAESKFNTALDCAVLYYVTQDSQYAQCAADILHNAVKTLLPVAPSASTGNGGWVFQDDLLKEARILGCQLPVVFDFLYAFLQTNQVYDVQTAGLVSFNIPNAQTVFRTYYTLVRDHGQRDSNWSALMATCMLNSLLALTNTTERTAYLQHYLYTNTTRQASLNYDYRYYNNPGDIWPESLQYAGAVGSIRTLHMALIERYDPARNLFNSYPNFSASLPRIPQLSFPNKTMQISFGDGHRDTGGQSFLLYEKVYQHARARSYSSLVAQFGGLIQGGVAASEYNRATLDDYESLGMHNEPLQLLWHAATIPEAANPLQYPRTDELPWAGIALQRVPSTVSNSTYGLMCFVGGAGHVHSHASGMSMELYGLGQVLGAKAGVDDYAATITDNYYRLFAANNTIIVNGASRGEGGWNGMAINTVQTVAMEPQPFAAAVSPNFSFTCSSFVDDKGTLAEGTQQRTLAIVRTSPTTGFYVDFFRSKSTVTNRVATTLSGNVTNQFHDYIYRNVGSTNISVTTNGVSLPLVSQPSRFQNDIGDSYDQPGWRYFSNTVVSYPHSQPVRAQFVATPAGTPLYMDAILPTVTNREYAQVSSPPIVDYNSTAKSPTMVVRQIGDAWDKPFAAVFEPHYSASGSTVTNVTALWRSNLVVGLQIESVLGGSGRVHYVFSNPNATETYTNAAIGLTFKGRFGIVADNGDGTTDLYLGQGSSLAYRGNSVNVVGGTNSQAEVQFTPGQSPSITANAPVTVVPASAPVFSLITRQPDGSISLQSSGSNGVPYRLWGKTNLSSGSWTLLNSGTVTNSPFVISDGGAVSNVTRFYRFSTP